jgi:methyl-accepting chemotaxis protein
MSLGKKLFFIVSCSILVTILVAGVAVFNIKNLGQSVSFLLTSGHSIQNHLEADMMHDALRGDVLRALYLASKQDDRIGTKEEVMTDLVEHSERFREVIKNNLKLELSPTIASKLKNVGPALDNYISNAEKIVETAFKDEHESLNLLPEFNKAFSELEEVMEVLSEDLSQDGSHKEQEALEVVSFAQIIMLSAVCIAIVLGCVFLYITNRTVTKVLCDTTEQLQAVSKQLFLAADQVSSGAHSLAQGASEQAAALQQTSATVQEASSFAKKNASNAHEANSISQVVSTSSENGAKSMEEMRRAIDSIQTAASETAEIVKTIDDIAFQTNLLALNAAVEAARAGDAGKGFAVVAEEVRGLAQRSATAAKETSEKIRKSLELSEGGVIVSRNVEKSLTEIRESSNKAVLIVKEISEASQEQAAGLSQLTGAVTELDTVTQNNAATAEESSASAEELKDQAKSLDRAIGTLSRLIYGEKHA